jgi:gp16 family phage-associated protein
MPKRLSKGIFNTSVLVAREWFTRTGKCVNEWARENGFSPGLVYEVLSGKRRCLRGQSHRIAVLLKIKDGVIEEN